MSVCIYSLTPSFCFLFCDRVSPLQLDPPVSTFPLRLHTWGLTWVLGIQTQVPMFVRQTFY